MLRSSWILRTIGLCVCASVLACSSDVQTGPEATGSGAGGSPSASSSATMGTGATVGVGGGVGGEGGGTPVTCDTADAVVLAMDNLFLGDTNPDGSPNKSDGWRQYGFNIDGLVSTATSTDLCQPYAGALTANVYADGDNGIDNSFGRNILPMLLALASDVSSQVNQAIQQGVFTVLFKLEGLGAGADYDPLPTKMYGAAGLGKAATFDGTDCWPVIPEILSNPTDIESTTIAYPNATLAGNAWSSNGESTVTLSVPLAGVVLKIIIHHARLSMTLDADHGGAVAGQLGGVLDREEFADSVRDIAAQFGIGCTDPTSEAIVDQLRQAADIMKDGTQDPASVCDGISIGIGFTAKADGRGPIGPKTPVGLDPCP